MPTSAASFPVWRIPYAFFIYCTSLPAVSCSCWIGALPLAFHSSRFPHSFFFPLLSAFKCRSDAMQNGLCMLLAVLQKVEEWNSVCTRFEQGTAWVVAIGAGQA